MSSIKHIIGSVLVVIIVYAASISSAHEVSISSTMQEVNVQESGISEWRVAAKDEALKPGATIKTSFGGEAVLSLPGNSSMILQPESSLTLEKITGSETEGPTEIKLLGTALFKMDGKAVDDAPVIVKTESATVDLRDSTAQISTNKDGTTSVIVVEGSIIVSAQKTKLSVNKGFKAVVNLNDAPSAPQPINDEVISQINKNANSLKDSTAEANEETSENQVELAQDNIEEILEDIDDIIQESVPEPYDFEPLDYYEIQEAVWDSIAY